MLIQGLSPHITNISLHIEFVLGFDSLRNLPLFFRLIKILALFKAGVSCIGNLMT